jgi:hypothetical protein
MHKQLYNSDHQHAPAPKIDTADRYVILLLKGYAA